MKPPAGSHSIRQVLGEGWELFCSGFATVLPWVLAAELLQIFPLTGASSDSSDMGAAFSGFFDNLGWSISIGLAQAALYAIAVLRLAKLAGQPMPGKYPSNALRSLFPVFIGYLIYSLIVIVGLSITFAVFMIGLFIAGPLFGFVLCILPLAPTAVVSTALALFIFPAVLERRGPFAALSESSRLARTNWVKVSLVISVPAVALLAAWCVQNGPEVARGIHLYLDLVQRTEEGASVGDMGTLLDSLKDQGQPKYAFGWQLGGIVLGACAWWYTLAICYAQYLDLKAAEKA